MIAAKLTDDPREAGLPDHFRKWRLGQREAAGEIAYGEGDCVITMPTGLGKSGTYIAGANLSGAKTVILTSTKGLQDQLMKDFAKIGMVEVRGKANYICPAKHGPTAEFGLCNYGMKCEMMKGGCPYYDALRRFIHSRICVTNYAMWLATGELLNAELLVMDEGHSAPDQLANSLTVKFNLQDLSEAGLGLSPVLEEEWETVLEYEAGLFLTTQEISAVDPELSSPFHRDLLPRIAKALRIIRKLRRIAGGEVVTKWEGETCTVSPVQTNRYLHLLNKDAGKMVIISATATPRTAEMLGLEQFKHLDFKSPFPVENRPVIQIPTIKMDRNTTNLAPWVSRIDQIIGKRLDRKGIIHTVSYERAKFLIKHSRYAINMIHHASSSTAKAVKAFIRAKAPCILVSPSLSTGWDFPYDQCAYQIISKVPFPDATDPVFKARCKLDKLLPFYLAWQEIIQASGRGMRGEDDFCETFIIDDHFSWLKGRYKSLAPSWFLDAIIRSDTIPEPIERGGRIK